MLLDQKEDIFMNLFLAIVGVLSLIFKASSYSFKARVRCKESYGTDYNIGLRVNLPNHCVTCGSRNSLGCLKKRDITFKFCSFLNFEKSSKNSTRLLKWKNHQNDASVKGHTIKILVKAQKKIRFSMFCNLIREIES